MTDKRPSLGELKTETTDPWACPRCGCMEWRVHKSYSCKDGAKKRIRYCRNCKHIRTSYETFEKPREADNEPSNILKLA